MTARTAISTAATAAHAALLPPRCTAPAAGGHSALPWLFSTAARLLDATQRALGLPASDGWALWRQATGGDPHCAHRLVRQLTPAALALARRMLGKLEDAEDVVQESFLRLWSAQPSDRHGAQLSTYFHTIVLNRCRSHLVRRRELSLGPDDLAALHDRHQQDHETAPDHSTHHTPDAARLQAALGALPPRQRMALAMWAYADADVPQIASALEIDTNAAHQLLFRAKRGLRQSLQAEDRT